MAQPSAASRSCAVSGNSKGGQFALDAALTAADRVAASVKGG